MKRKIMAMGLMLALLAMSLGALTTSADVARVGEDLLVNGGFETVMANNALRPASWNAYAASGTAAEGTNFMLVTGNEEGETVMPHSGTYMYKMTQEGVDSANRSRIYLYQTVSLDKLTLGQTYIFEGWLHTPVAGGVRAYVADTYSGTPVSGSMTLTTTATTEGWTKFSYLFRYDTSAYNTYAEKGYITICCSLTQFGTVYIDDLSFSQLAHPTLLSDTGQFESFHNATAFTGQAANWFDAYTTENTDYVYYSEDGDAAIKMIGGRTKAITFPYTTALTGVLAENTPMKITCRMKLTNATATATGANYDIRIVHNGATPYGHVYIPIDSLNKWVNVEYWFKWVSANCGSNIGFRQMTDGTGADYVIDDVEMHVADESEIAAGKTLGTWAAASNVALQGYSRTSDPDSAYTASETASSYVRYYNDTDAEKTVVAFTGIYETAPDGTKTLLRVTTAPVTAAAGASVGTTVTPDMTGITLESGKTYTGLTYLWDALDTMNPILDKAEYTLEA